MGAKLTEKLECGLLVCFIQNIHIHCTQALHVKIAHIRCTLGKWIYDFLKLWNFFAFLRIGIRRISASNVCKPSLKPTYHIIANNTRRFRFAPETNVSCMNFCNIFTCVKLKCFFIIKTGKITRSLRSRCTRRVTPKIYHGP